MLVFQPIRMSQTLSLAVIQPNQVHHNGSHMQRSGARSCKNISVMCVFSLCTVLVGVCHWWVIFCQWTNTATTT